MLMTTGRWAIVLEGKNIPIGTRIKITLWNEAEAQVVVQSDPLSGTEALSNATATLTILTGFNQIFTDAKWTP